MITRKHIIFYGYVQGVGFRYRAWGSAGGQGMLQISMAVPAGYTISGMVQSRWRYRGKKSR